MGTKSLLWYTLVGEEMIVAVRAPYGRTDGEK